MTPEFYSTAIGNFADWWAIVLLHSLWVGSISAATAALLLTGRRLKSANSRYVTALAALLFVPIGSVAATNLWQSGDSSNNATATVSESNTSLTVATPGDDDLTIDPTTPGNLAKPAEPVTPIVKSNAINLRRLFTALWCIGAALMLLRFVRSHYQANRIAATATVEIPEWLTDLNCRVKSEVQVLRDVSVRMTDSVALPMVYGVLTPVILLPTTVVTGLSQETLRVILAHELAHIRRGDLLFGIIERLVEAVFFFHPGVWWLLRQVQNEREACCDLIAADVVGARFDVAAALVNSAETISHSVAKPAIRNVAMAIGDGQLEDRVKRLVDPEKPPRINIALPGLVALLVLGLIGLMGLTAGTASVATQVAKALSPKEQVQSVADVIKSVSPEVVTPQIQTEQEIRGRIVFPGEERLPPGPIRRNVTVHVEGRKRSSGIGISLEKDGTFLTKEAMSPATVYVQARVNGYETSVFGPFTLGNQSLDVGELKLKPGFSTQLKFVNATGDPVPGVEIESVDQKLDQDEGKTLRLGGPSWYRGLSSDEHGVIPLHHCGSLPTGIRVRKSGFEFDGKTVLLKPGETFEWKLKRSEETKGRLVDVSGKPVVGAQIYLCFRSGPFSTRTDPRDSYLTDYERQPAKGRTATDADGRFVLTTLRRDSKYVLMAISTKHQPLIFDELTGGSDLKTSTMQPPIEFSGRIVGDLSGLRKINQSDHRSLMFYNSIDLKSGYGSSSGHRARVAPDGTFSIPLLIPGNLRLYVGGRQFDYHIEKSRTDVQINIDAANDDPSQSLRPVKVVFATPDDRPVVGTIHLSWQLAADADTNAPRNKAKYFRLNSEADSADESGGKTVDHRGLELTPVRGNEIEWAAPRGAKIYLSARDLVGSIIKSKWYDKVPEGEGDHRIEVPVQAAGLFSGQFLDSAGQPVKNFQIHVRGDLEKGKLPFTQFETIKHADGRFAIGPLPLGTGHQYQVYLSPQNDWQFSHFGSFEISNSTPVIKKTIRLVQPVRLRGTIVDATGAPRPNTSIGLYVRSRNLHLQHSAGPTKQTDNRGQFEILTTQMPLAAKLVFEVFPQKGNAGRTIEFPADNIRADGNLGAIKVGPGATVAGRVVDESGSPINNASVLISAKVGATPKYKGVHVKKTDTDGRFRVEGIEHVPAKVNVISHRLVKISAPFQRSDQASIDEGYLENPANGALNVTIVVRKE